MFKSIAASIEFEGVGQKPRKPESIPNDVVNSVFKVLHGSYGQQFLAKFATGELNGQGKDIGIISARQVWTHGLRGFDAKIITEALVRTLERHPDFPPSLPQFIAICSACKPSEIPEALKRIGMSPKSHCELTRKAREAALAKIHQIKRSRSAADTAPGLNLLVEAIANAVANAGGDEVAELRRLEALFPPRAKA